MHQTSSGVLKLTLGHVHQQEHHKACPKYNVKSLGEVPSATLPSLWKFFLSWSTSQVLLYKITCWCWGSGQSWPYGASDWLSSILCHGPAVGHCLRRDSTGLQKVEKEMPPMTRDETPTSTLPVLKRLRCQRSAPRVLKLSSGDLLVGPCTGIAEPQAWLTCWQHWWTCYPCNPDADPSDSPTSTNSPRTDHYQQQVYTNSASHSQKTPPNPSTLLTCTPVPNGLRKYSYFPNAIVDVNSLPADMATCFQSQLFSLPD